MAKRDPAKGIRKTSAGTYQARVMLDGRRRCRTFASLADAKFWLREQLAHHDRVQRGLDGLEAGHRTFGELCQQWLSTWGKHKRSLVTDESFIRVHLIPFFGAGAVLREIGRTKVDAYRERKAREVSKNTVNHHLTLLGTMLRAAQRENWLREVPHIARFRAAEVNPDPERFRYLRDRDEIDRFLEAAALHENPQLHPLYATAVMTGLRLGELAGLRWSDISFDEALVNVRRSYGGPTKSGWVRRVPLPSRLVPILKRWRLQTSGDLVFVNGRGSMVRRDSPPFRSELQSVLIDAGFARDYLTFHSLRHTFAAQWVSCGGSIYALSRVLGHHSVVVTETRFAHLADSFIAHEAARLRY